MAHILIIGAGVIGLQTANDLLDKGYKVTVLAKHWPGDESIEYTSPWAGAIWRTQALPDQVEVCDWQRQSYQLWMSTLKESPEEAESMGMQRVPLTIYSDDPENDPSSPRMWYSTFVQDFALLPPASLPSNGPKSGHSFASIVINPGKYLTYLLTRAKSRGLRTITATLPASTSFASAISAALGHRGGEDAELVINCTGLGAHKLGDTTMFPIRGQTLLVRITPPPSTSRVTLYDSKPVTYIVPRRLTSFHSGPSDATYFIGGTNDADNWDAEPTPEITHGILQRVKGVMSGWADDGAEIEVLREQVGLRPGRKGGPRVEIEEVDVGSGSGATRKVKVVHQYGHAGAGFQNSIGSARKAVGLVKEVLG